MADWTNKAFWDRMARLYAPFQEWGNRNLYQQLSRTIIDGVSRDAVVLELACGSGQLTLPLCDLFAQWEATDYSEKMVDQAKKRARGLSAMFSVQDATDLSYPDASWDVVVAANMLHVMPRPDEALAEIKRVLKPDGTFVAATFVYENAYDFKKMKPLEKLGFKTYFKWTSEDFIAYVETHGFSVETSVLLSGKSLSESVLFCRQAR